jgi:hypothetical protein
VKNFEVLETKLKAAKGNAAQGSMGFPFAISKIPDIKEAIKPINENLLLENKETNLMSQDIAGQDTKLSTSKEF